MLYLVFFSRLPPAPPAPRRGNFILRFGNQPQLAHSSFAGANRLRVHSEKTEHLIRQSCCCLNPAMHSCCTTCIDQTLREVRRCGPSMAYGCTLYDASTIASSLLAAPCSHTINTQDSSKFRVVLVCPYSVGTNFLDFNREDCWFCCCIVLRKCFGGRQAEPALKHDCWEAAEHHVSHNASRDAHAPETLVMPGALVLELDICAPLPSQVPGGFDAFLILGCSPQNHRLAEQGWLRAK